MYGISFQLREVKASLGKDSYLEDPGNIPACPSQQSREQSLTHPV